MGKKTEVSHGGQAVGKGRDIMLPWVLKKSHYELENGPLEVLDDAVGLSGKTQEDGENSTGIFN